MSKPRLVVFTGSGISAESGITTFRGDANSVWNNYKIEDVCTVQAMADHRERVFDFFNAAHDAIKAAEPNAAHFELARLEQDFDVTIITQNVDDLHERAGSTKVVHLHGEITKMRHNRTDEILDRPHAPLAAQSDYRPHVVLFGEMPYNYDEAEELCESADYGMVIGTSLEVYPAAMLVHRFQVSCPVILVDPNPPLSDRNFVNISVVKETAVVGLPQAANLLLVDLAKRQ